MSAEEFKASGWHIPRAQLVKKSSIGKGEYGGRCEREEREREGEGGKEGRYPGVLTGYAVRVVMLIL